MVGRIGKNFLFYNGKDLLPRFAKVLHEYRLIEELRIKHILLQCGSRVLEQNPFMSLVRNPKATYFHPIYRYSIKLKYAKGVLLTPTHLTLYCGL